MRKLSEALGQDRWVQIQRSPLKEQIRNCSVDDVTIGDVILMTGFFGFSCLAETVEIVFGKSFSNDNNFKDEIRQYNKYLNNGGTMSFEKWIRDGRFDPSDIEGYPFEKIYDEIVTDLDAKPFKKDDEARLGDCFAPRFGEDGLEIPKRD
jgi:hypothetical protein